MESALKAETSSDWSIQDSIDLYLIDRWGAGYFGVNEEGHVTVAPMHDPSHSISVFRVLERAMQQDLNPPVLVRFQDMVRHRVQVLNEAFRTAIAEYGYESSYRTVYPIKVNQLREVVEEIVDAGRAYNLGLEAGSKPELYAALAIHHDSDPLIVCNGYKDAHYVRAALMGRKLGKKVILVAEKLSEVDLIIRLSREMEVEPLVGLRLRLATEGSGRQPRLPRRALWACCE